MNSTTEILTKSDWKARMAGHADKLSGIVSAHLNRASRQQKHPVIDFLFQYYRFSPVQLMRWSPGWGKMLVGQGEGVLLEIKEGIQSTDGWTLDPAKFPHARLDSVKWVKQLQSNISERDPRFGCFGLHEWAMVYRSDRVRHQDLPLRLSSEETANVVETMTISCSHYDAFRFFTPEARGLNKQQPTLDKRIDNEQCGCLHVNMDLYKWSSMFYPWVSSDLVADCFLLAYEIREVDMRASAYDVTVLGYQPICIETDAGQEEYRSLQKEFTEKSKPLRRRLVSELAGLLDSD